MKQDEATENNGDKAISFYLVLFNANVRKMI